MPYLAKVRMRTNCDRGISRVVCGSGAAGVSRSSGRTGAAGESIRSTRGLRVDRSVVVVRDAGIVGVLTGGGFEVNKASAAWRARVICSDHRRGFSCCGRLSKICPEMVV